MNFRSTGIGFATGALALGIWVAGPAAWTPAEGPATALAQEAPLDRSAIENIVREYLLANPDLLVEVQKALEAKRDAERAESQKKALVELKDMIYESDYQVDIGSQDAPITIVEFFDYNCSFCQRALGDMQKFIEDDPSVRFILKEFPVLGPASVEAHRVSLAFRQLHPDKAGDFHIKLLAASGRKDGATAMALAESLGADRTAIEAEMEKPYIEAAIREAYTLADRLGITGTPSYVIGEEVVFGAVGFGQLNQKVASIKECGKATC